MATHSRGERNFKCDHPGCTKSFYANKELKRHKKSHLGVKQFVCNVCSSGFIFRYALTKHKKLVHEQEPQYQCEYCHKKMKSSATLTEHLRMHTGNFVRFYAFLSFMLLIFDKQMIWIKLFAFTFQGERPYKCKHCENTFAYANAYRDHVMIHDKNRLRYKCPFCEKNILPKWIRNHIKKQHAGEDDPGEYKKVHERNESSSSSDEEEETVVRRKRRQPRRAKQAKSNGNSKVRPSTLTAASSKRESRAKVIEVDGEEVDEEETCSSSSSDDNEDEESENAARKRNTRASNKQPRRKNNKSIYVDDSDDSEDENSEDDDDWSKEETLAPKKKAVSKSRKLAKPAQNDVGKSKAPTSSSTSGSRKRKANQVSTVKVPKRSKNMRGKVVASTKKRVLRAPHNK